MTPEFDPDKDTINRGKHGLMLELGAEVFVRSFIEEKEEEDDRLDYRARAAGYPAQGSAKGGVSGEV